MDNVVKDLIAFIKDTFGGDFISHHAPTIDDAEQTKLIECLKSTYVSSVGPLIKKFESEICDFTGANNAIACSSGTAALHLALTALGVQRGDYVITQSFSFVATANSIQYTGADPIFLDIDPDTWSLCPTSLLDFLSKHAECKFGKCYLKSNGRQIKVIVLMHTFGNPGYANKLKKIADDWGIFLVEDCAESLGAKIKSVHTGLIGLVGCFSFNGNKIITTGGGGAVISNDKILAEKIRHLSTTARIGGVEEFEHDMVGFNYRMPNLNAALGLAQIDKLPKFVAQKRKLADRYAAITERSDIGFFKEVQNSTSNYWLSTILFPGPSERNHAFETFRKNGIDVRKPWMPSHKLKMYSKNVKDKLQTTTLIHANALSLPSTPTELI